MRTIILASIAALMLASAADAQTATSTTAASKTTPAAKTSTKASKPTVPSSAPASAPAGSATPTKATGGRKPQTAASKACSAQADAKNLHGKDRNKFRRACMKGSA